MKFINRLINIRGGMMRMMVEVLMMFYGIFLLSDVMEVVMIGSVVLLVVSVSVSSSLF